MYFAILLFSCSEDTNVAQSTVVLDSCSNLSLLKEIEKQVVRDYDYRQFKKDVKRDIIDYPSGLKLDKEECIANYVGDCTFGVLCIFSGTHEVTIDGFFNSNNDIEIDIPIVITKKYSIKHDN